MLEATPVAGHTWLVLGMLQDKDVTAFTESLLHTVDHWCLASLDVDRGLTAAELHKMLPGAATPAEEFPNVDAACRYAHSRAAAGDRVVVCGSFITVAKATACHV
jgi:dihydrofolate synthase/folylpolyglutamate synthase